MPNTQTHSMDGTTPAPNSWYHQEQWRETYPWEEDTAALARLSLARLGLYPSSDLAPDPGFATHEANHRAALHQIVDRLDRTDLTATFRLARLLLLIPRQLSFFTRILTIT